MTTGLLRGDVDPLGRAEKELLAGWHQTVAGDDNGRLWLPAAVRALPVDGRLELAEDHELDAAWQERERRRVEGDVEYFIRGYGHLKTDPLLQGGRPVDLDATGKPKGGPPIPFAMWEEQGEVLVAFQVHDRVVVLKARQLGLTWLALHYGYHLIAFDPDGTSSTVLGLSQDGNYAKGLLEKMREIRELLPPFLRHPEQRDTRDSKTEMKLVGRGKFVSLMGTPAAPRSHQADLAICDEWAFVRNGNAGPTMTALDPAARQIIAISSGNGPPEEEGWGQHFARLYTEGAAGQNGWHAIFLPTSTHPARDEEWRAQAEARFDTEEEYLAEHPETPDDGLIGAGKDRYFKLADINAAVKAGAGLVQLLGTDDMPPPAGEAIHLGVDWGEASQAYAIWPLEGGGVFVPPSEVAMEGGEPGETTAEIHRVVLEELQDVDPATGRLGPPIGEARYDAAGAQSMRTFLAQARDRFSQQYADGEVRSRKVPFGEFKKETAGYLRRLFRRVGQGRTVGIIAIAPENTELIRQLRALESGRDVWKKADDQHGPDALVAGVQRIARVHRKLRGD